MTSRLRKLLGLPGLGVGFVFGVLTLILGEVGGPFPPSSPPYGPTSAGPLQGLLFVAPFLLAVGFLLGGVAFTGGMKESTNLES